MARTRTRPTCATSLRASTTGVQHRHRAPTPARRRMKCRPLLPAGQALVRKNLTLAGKTRLMLNTATVPGMATRRAWRRDRRQRSGHRDRMDVLGSRRARGAQRARRRGIADALPKVRPPAAALLPADQPGSQPANATVTFLRQVGTPIVKQAVVPAYARVTIPVNTADPAWRHRPRRHRQRGSADRRRALDVSEQRDQDLRPAPAAPA